MQLISCLSYGAEKALKLADVKKIISCSPPLMSHWIEEKGFAKEFAVKYGHFEFVRFDVGDPDGKLVVKENGQPICELNLSLNPDIYFSTNSRLMIFSAYSGSSSWFEIYKFTQGKCQLMGKTIENSKAISNLIKDTPCSKKF